MAVMADMIFHIRSAKTNKTHRNISITYPIDFIECPLISIRGYGNMAKNYLTTE